MRRLPLTLSRESALRHRGYLAATAAGVGLLGAVAALGFSEPGPYRTPTPWRLMHATSIARYEVSAARIGRFAYILGGFTTGAHQPTGLLERYDLSTGRSKRLASMPVGIDHVGLVSYRGI